MHIDRSNLPTKLASNKFPNPLPAMIDIEIINNANNTSSHPSSKPVANGLSTSNSEAYPIEIPVQKSSHSYSEMQSSSETKSAKREAESPLNKSKTRVYATDPARTDNSYPKPIPSTYPTPLGDVSFPLNFGTPSAVPSTMPKPAVPPFGGMGNGDTGNMKGILQTPGHRTAPRRGRGTMNQASASRIPMCASCQRQIR